MNIGRFVAILLTLSASSSVAQTFSTPIPVSKNAGAHSPVLHIGRDGTVYVSWFERNADVYFARSADGGKTFTAPVRASRQVTTNNYTSLLQRSPEFVLDTKGVIHMTWVEGRIKGPDGKEQSDTWYIRSTDKGDTWSMPMSVMDADDSTKYSQDFSAIAADSSDNLYISYLDNRYLMRGIGDHYRMHMQRSTDGGASWSKAVVADKLPIATSGTCECCRQDIAVSPEGHVYIAFRTNMTTPSDGDKRDIFICRSWDRGVTWDSSIRCQLGEWTLTACPTKGPHIALDRDEHLHLAWNDARDDSGKLIAYFSLLKRGESQIFPNYSLSNSRTQQATWPDITIGPGGTLATAYQLTSGGANRFSYSTDGGNSWTNSVYPGTDGSLPIVRFDALGNLYTVWEDGTANGILFSKVTNLKAPVGPGTITVPSTQTFKSGAVKLHWPPPVNLRRGSFVWYHVFVNGAGFKYDNVVRDTSVDLGVLAYGMYGYSITAYTCLDSSITNAAFLVGASDVRLPTRGECRIELYPNPVTTGTLMLHLWSEVVRPLYIAVRNSAGVTVMQSRITPSGNHAELDVRSLPAGSYFATITDAEGSNKFLQRVEFVVE